MEANGYRGAVSIELDKTRVLRIDFNALVLAEEKLGKLDLSQILTGGFKTLRALLWAGLVADDPSLTEEKVGSMIGPADFQRVARAIAQSINGGSLPEVGEELKNEQRTEAGA